MSENFVTLYNYAEIEMRYALFIILLTLGFGANALDFEGLTAKAVEVTAPANSGLDGIYVVPDSRGATMVYTASSATSDVRWARYSRMGAAYAQDLAPQRDGVRITMACDAEDMGYVIEENGRSRYYWIISYADHYLDLQSIGFAAEQDCDRAHLTFGGKAAELEAYSPTGRRIGVSRELEVQYNTLAFDDQTFSYHSTTATATLGGIDASFSVAGPLCDTRFTLSGDRFLEAWGAGQSVESELYKAVGVEARTRATQTERDADNEQRVDAELGGSAPADITFEAAVTDGAIFTEWQISRSADFNDVYNSFSELEFTYSFTEQGTTYVRFTANNAAGTCPYEGDTYKVFIGESKLDIPNAFSPGASPGVNDLWKVSYKSIVTYKCTIFNRWGKKLFESDDPSVGWDGMTGSKIVPPGVYFYVIKAVGADGVKYDRAGDINVIGFNEGNVSSSNTETDY